MLDDFRFGLRTLGRSLGFTLVAVAVLALGIGINAAVFSLVNGVLFKNLPFHDSERVLYLVSAGSHQKRGLFGLSYPISATFRRTRNPSVQRPRREYLLPRQFLRLAGLPGELPMQ